MNRSSDFQTGGLVLLASTVMCGGLAVAIAAPLLGGNKQGKSLAQRTSGTSEVAQPHETYAEFYPADQSITPLPPATETQAPRKVLAERYGDLNFNRKATGKPSPAYDIKTDSTLRTSSASFVSPSSLTSDGRGRDAQQGPKHGRTAESLYSGNSKTGNPPSRAYSSLPLREGYRSFSKSTPTYRSLSDDPGTAGSVYAPITIHPVTVNVDGGVFADQLATMTQRFEALLDARNSVRQEMEEAAAKTRKVQRNERRNVKPAVSNAHEQQLEQLNTRLQDIADSFERFQNQTQRAVHEISNEGRRTEIAFEEIRSVQRQLESQIERARRSYESDAAVVHLPAIPAAVETLEPAVETAKPAVETLEPGVETLEPAVETLEPGVETLEPAVETLEPGVETLEPAVETAKPAVETVHPVSEFPAFASSVIRAVSSSADVPSVGRSAQVHLPRAAPEFSSFNTSAASVRGEPFAVGRADPVQSSVMQVERDPFTREIPVLTFVQSEDMSASAQVTVEPNDGGDVPHHQQQILPQTDNNVAPPIHTETPTELLLAHKTRRLMEEAENAKGGDAVNLNTRAMQAISLGNSRRSVASHPDQFSTDNEPVDGLTPFPPVVATTVVGRASGDARESVSDHQQALQFLVQARAAIAAGNVQQATKLANRADALDTTYGLMEDSPWRLREDLAWLAETRSSSSVGAKRTGQIQRTAHTQERVARVPGETVQAVHQPKQSSSQSVAGNGNFRERNTIKRVAYEHVYRFPLDQVESIPESSADGVPCKKCGRIHGADPDPDKDAFGDGDAAQQSSKRRLIAPHAARRSNRSQTNASNDTTETSGIWSTLAFLGAGGNTRQNETRPQSCEAPNGGVRCRECGLVHGAATHSDNKSVSEVKPVQESPQRSLNAPHAGRRSNRSQVEAANDTTEAAAIWSTPAFPGAEGDMRQNVTRRHLQEAPIGGVRCIQCGLVHGAVTPVHKESVAEVKPAQESPQRSLIAPHAGRRSNRSQVEAANDTTEAAAIWSTPAFPGAGGDASRNMPRRHLAETPIGGVRCIQCGLVHGTVTHVHKESVAAVKRTQQIPQRSLIAPYAARRSNRSQLAAANDTTEAAAIWSTPAFPVAGGDADQNAPSTLHRLSSAIRRIGRPAAE